MTKGKATLIGLAAIVLWSTIVGMIRSVSESLGVTGGAAMIYSVAFVLLLFTVGFPQVRSFPRRYLFWGSLLFVAYEVCLSLSIGYANSSRQAIEVAMVNYLWPSFTMLFAILFNNQKATWLVVPGFICALFGVCWVLGGKDGFNLLEMLQSIRSNPLAFALAFVGALIWATYCTVTSKIAGGKNGITLFFMLTATVLWTKYLIEGSSLVSTAFSYSVIIQLVLSACAMGFGYAFWNIGILHGNVTFLAGASYFTPILSSALAAVILNSSLSISFWQGAVMVCAGSILCWLATRKPQSV